MRDRRRPLTVPASYRRIEIEGKGEHPLKHPRADVVARVFTAFATGAASSLVERVNGDASGVSLWEAAAGADVIGMVVGLLWSHPSRDLETRRRHYDAGEDGDLDYGDAVFAELLSDGYSDADVATLGGAAMGSIVDAMSPAPEVVEARVENGRAPA